jgi:hypothetical protein
MAMPIVTGISAKLIPNTRSPTGSADEHGFPASILTDNGAVFTAELELARHYRLRHDKVDPSGVITLRHNSRLHHIGLGRRHAGTRVLVLVADLHIRVLTQDGRLLRALTLDPARDYQPQHQP